MSRCMPFPPPGYAGKCSSNEALIVSIKLQREREIAISNSELQKVKSTEKKRGSEKVKLSSDEKKERKREKKEKKERKDKLKVHPAVDIEKQKIVATVYNAEDVLRKQNLLKQEVLEQSNLTEEHGRPVDSQNASCSSDSTGNSGKRKRHSSPASSIQGNGNIIRIRLSSQKKDVPSTSGSTPSQKNEDDCSLVPSCSNLVRTESFVSPRNQMFEVQEPVRSASMSLSTATLELVSRKQNDSCTSQERVSVKLPPSDVPSTSGRMDTEKPSRKLSSHEKKMLKRESLYNNLFQNLAPPTLYSDLMVTQDDDEDWLFGKKDTERPAKRSRGSNDLQAPVDNLPCSASAALQPRAQFLPEVGVYALPFTVPF